MWLNPCPGGLTCQGCIIGGGQQGPQAPQAPGSGGRCWCEGDWNRGDSWEDLCEYPHGLPPACPDHIYPRETTDHALIEKSNTYVCDGGTNDGEGCDLGEPADCPAGTCKGTCCGEFNDGNPCADDADCNPFGICVKEKFLEVNVTTETIGDLYIRTEPTAANTDSLDIRFESRDPGGNTLTVRTLTIDALEGALTLHVNGLTTLQTD